MDDGVLFSLFSSQYFNVQNWFAILKKFIKLQQRKVSTDLRRRKCWRLIAWKEPVGLFLDYLLDGGGQKARLG